jgi:hypothetical protein
MFESCRAHFGVHARDVTPLTRSVQFSWALDCWGGHDQPPDPRVQQLVRNAFAAMTQ